MGAYLWRTSICLALLLSFALARGSSAILAADGVADPNTLEQQVHELVNNHRTAIGFEPLTYNKEIARVARRHSHSMANGHAGMGHEGADERRGVLAQTITYNQFAENVAANSSSVSSTAQVALTGWLNSPGHRANIEGNCHLTGIGIARRGSTFFFTQIFLTTTRSSRPSTEPRHPSNHTSQRGYSVEPKHNEPSTRSRRADTPSYEEESDPRKRSGRKRVHGGYVQDLGNNH